jgi:peptidoglycan/xylan/chitin deacetylase (PgdA/CDA1 family)
MDDGKPPGIGPMGNTLPAGAFDSNALPWGSYGSNRGIERLLDVLVRTRIRASVMTSGILAQRFPQIIRAIAEAGHEIVAHSWAQDIIPATLAPEQVRADILKTSDILTDVAGVRPCGWISPRGTPVAFEQTDRIPLRAQLCLPLIARFSKNETANVSFSLSQHICNTTIQSY